MKLLHAITLSSALILPQVASGNETVTIDHLSDEEKQLCINAWHFAGAAFDAKLARAPKQMLKTNIKKEVGNSNVLHDINNIVDLVYLPENKNKMNTQFKVRDICLDKLLSQPR